MLSSDAFRQLVSEPHYDPKACSLIHMGSFVVGKDDNVPDAVYQARERRTGRAWGENSGDGDEGKAPASTTWAALLSGRMATCLMRSIRQDKQDGGHGEQSVGAGIGEGKGSGEGNGQ